ncbi:RNA polymerase sigma factor [Xylanibacter caecicola]|uniref:RNA polymerase sigma factor n=1 Tax=Xylanibacter caecicola TaxID=2736294 RepID=UPI00258C424B|nr:sigma-70 family RNA polymerase sigma factor [Xylanibacter caecicola]
MTVSDKDIILAMKRYPDKGFRLLMDAYKEPVYWHIRRLVVAHADAQDVAQETFVRIFRSFSRFDEGCSLRAWIYRIATNETLRMLDRNGVGRLSLDDREACAGCIAAGCYVDYSDLETVLLQNAILSLPPRQQIVFNLRYYDDMDYKEIAGITASTVSAVKANYHIAKGKIIQYMNSHD